MFFWAKRENPRSLWNEGRFQIYGVVPDRVFGEPLRPSFAEDIEVLVVWGRYSILQICDVNFFFQVFVKAGETGRLRSDFPNDWFLSVHLNREVELVHAWRFICFRSWPLRLAVLPTSFYVSEYIEHFLLSLGALVQEVYEGRFEFAVRQRAPSFSRPPSGVREIVYQARFFSM